MSIITSPLKDLSANFHANPANYQTFIQDEKPETVPSLDPALPNYTALFQETLVDPDSSGFITRAFRATKTLLQEKGLLYTSAQLGLSTLATLYTANTVFLELLGSGYAMEAMWGRGDLVGSELGDAGGWTSLAGMDLIALYFLFKNQIAEAESIGIKKICRTFIDHVDISREDLYDMILARLASIDSETLFSKTKASRILIALELVGEPDEEAQYDKKSNWAKDAALIDVFRKIESESQQGNTCKRYFQQLYQGQRSVNKRMGFRGVMSHLALGAAGPLFLLGNTINDLIGTIKLGEEVLGTKAPEIGHVGEWQSNIFQNLGVAGYLHNRYLVAPGKVAVMKKIYKQQLRQLREPGLHSRLREIANQDLSEMGFSGTAFPKDLYPTEVSENRASLSLIEDGDSQFGPAQQLPPIEPWIEPWIEL